MTLHDRIMHEADRHNIDTDHGCGYVDGMTRSATLAKEADKLMAEMGNALASIDPDDLPRMIKGRVALAINHYNTYMERNNEQ